MRSIRDKWTNYYHTPREDRSREQEYCRRVIAPRRNRQACGSKDSEQQAVVAISRRRTQPHRPAAAAAIIAAAIIAVLCHHHRQQQHHLMPYAPHAAHKRLSSARLHDPQRSRVHRTLSDQRTRRGHARVELASRIACALHGPGQRRAPQNPEPAAGPLAVDHGAGRADSQSMRDQRARTTLAAGLRAGNALGWCVPISERGLAAALRCCHGRDCT